MRSAVCNADLHAIKLLFSMKSMDVFENQCVHCTLYTYIYVHADESSVNLGEKILWAISVLEKKATWAITQAHTDTGCRGLAHTEPKRHLYFIGINDTLQKSNEKFFITLFLHVTWILYLESGQRLSSASCVSVSRFPIIPPPKISQLTRHWCCAGSFAYHSILAIVNDLSRCIERTDNSNLSDASKLSAFVDWWSTTDASDERGAQLFQHCTKGERSNSTWVNNHYYVMNIVI